MKTLIFQLSIRRSGTHVIGEWVQKQLSLPNKNILNVKYPLLERKDDLATEVPKARYNALIISFESWSLEIIDKIEVRNHFAKSFGKYDKIHYLIGLRDPWNLFASRIKHGIRRLRHPADYLWVEYAKAFIEKPYDAQYVLYHEFLSKITTRCKLSKALGGEFDDSLIDRVPRYGGGSSFDGVDYDGEGRKMAIFSRWRECWEDDSFRALFTPEINDLAKKIFGTDDPREFEEKMENKLGKGKEK